MILDDQLMAFKKIYKETFGAEITDAGALEMTKMLLNLFRSVRDFGGDITQLK